MVNGNRVFYDADNIGVSGRVFYAKASDSKLYTDSALTDAADGGAVFQAFLAGVLVIVNDGAIAIPTAVTVAEGTVSVDILTVSSSTATVVTLTAAVATGDTKTAADFAKIVPSA
jgi:hypothetical protein